MNINYTSPQFTHEHIPLVVDRTSDLLSNIDRLLDISRSSPTQLVEKDEVDLKERLFDARAEFKVLLSQVSMHLNRDWVRGLFKQIDNLMDFDEWDKEDPVPQQTSALSLIRLLLVVKPSRRPGLGVSSHGTLVAAWTVGNNRLTIECQTADHLRWVLTREVEARKERAAGDCELFRICDVLRPYDPEIWFDHAK